MSNTSEPIVPLTTQGEQLSLFSNIPLDSIKEAGLEWYNPDEKRENIKEQLVIIEGAVKAIYRILDDQRE